MMFFFRRRSIPIYLRCRYVFDFIVALLIFILALPVMLIVSLLISLDGGSIIFWQARVGVSGKEFKVYKFRSMVENADDYLTESGRVSVGCLDFQRTKTVTNLKKWSSPKGGTRT